MVRKSDRELFTGVKKGDKEAFSELFLRHYDYLRHYGLQMSQDAGLIEECIQELFLYMFESHTRLGDIRQVKAYLFTALRRRILEKIKKQQTQLFGDLEFLEPSDIRFSEEDFLLQSENQTQISHALLEAVNSLSWRQREAIYLRYYNGLKTKDIAEIMGVANQTILNTLYQALKKIRRDKQLTKLFRFSISLLLLFSQISL